MPIIALPEKTVRLLGSAVVISSPVDVVKELLDNALDAEATSIEILISPNLIDRIQVRDNGHGIQADDYASLGCVGHTSKLHSFEELQTLGGKTLGFRGQALASANSLGRITVVTRCLGDQTAVKLTMCAGVGGIESQQRVSTPVGTTVTVTGLFRLIPVREQVAEKDAQKNLAKVKHLFHAYVLARPMIRLSLKVLGGDSRQKWSYSPRPGDSVREAVAQVFGAGVMAECVLKTDTCETNPLSADNAPGGSQITIEAVLPVPDADLSKLSKGSFFSVDSRPVSTSHGIIKKLISILKTHFKTSLAVDAADRRLGDIFTCVNVKCYPGAYDPNVEPSKNQVLFADESQLFELFEKLCSDAYENRRVVDAFATIERRPLTKQTQTQTPPPSSDGPHISSKPFTSHLDELPHAEHIRRPRTPEALGPKAFLRGPSAVYAGPPPQLSRHRAPEIQMKASLQSSPPPTNATRHKAFEETDSTEHMNVFKPLAEAGHEPAPRMEHAPAAGPNSASRQPHPSSRTPESHEAGNSVPDPVSSSDGPGRKRKFAVNMSADPELSSDEEAEDCGPASCDLQDTIPRHEEPRDSSREALNPWTIARMTAPARQTTADNTAEDSASRHVLHAEEPREFPVPVEPFEKELPILQPHMGAPRDLDTPRVKRFSKRHRGHLKAPDITHPRPSGSRYPQTNSPETNHELSQSLQYADRSTEKRQLPDFRPHSNTLAENVDRDGLIQTTLSFKEPRESQHDVQTQAQLRIDDVPTRHNPPFRKPKRIKKHQQNYTPQDVDVNNERHGQPIQSRNTDKMTNIAMADHRLASFELPILRPVDFGNGLVDHLPTAAEINTFDGDSRQYLIRRQRSEAAHRGGGRQSRKRTKTDKLPLETIPGIGTAQLVLHLGHETAKTCIASKRTSSLTAYRDGVRFGDLMSLEDMNDIQSKLQVVVTSWTEKTFGRQADVDINLRKAVKRTVAA
ncbi:DNA mismatch repair protein mutL [Diaporthe helianthi]|uniref:DNA mismatch repair protein mutL n=1 Tax=Diaporthe helianthi TaxID=158607 RepID=A0A2P5I6A2_DIAHE|nr:DNA mismatch repair protein mutL [Diaporthe helianthi]